MPLILLTRHNITEAAWLGSMSQAVMQSTDVKRSHAAWFAERV